MPACEMDFRPGGVFRFVFRGPSGTDYPFNGAFREVVHEARIVYTGTIQDGVEVHTTLTFDERHGKTVLTVHQTYSFESDSTRGGRVGWTQTLDRLAEVRDESVSRGEVGVRSDHLSGRDGCALR